MPDGNVLVVVPTGSIEAISACGSVIAHAGNKVVVQSGKVQIGETVLEVSQDKAVPGTAAPAALANKEATLVDGKGIFICEYKVKGVNKKFNLYAASKDMNPGFAAKITGTAIENIQKKLAKNENFLGYGCTPFNNTEDLIENLKSGHYEGQWFIPSLDMMAEISLRSDKGDLKGIFNKSIGYVGLESVECPSSCEHLFDINNNKVDTGHYTTCSMRPVRLELVG